MNTTEMTGVKHKYPNGSAQRISYYGSGIRKKFGRVLVVVSSTCGDYENVLSVAGRLLHC